MTQSDLAPSTPPTTAVPGTARIWKLRTVAAAAITAVALAGAGGAALAVASDAVGGSPGPGGQLGRQLPGGGPTGNQQPPGFAPRPGQLPPATAPSTGTDDDTDT